MVLLLSLLSLLSPAHAQSYEFETRDVRVSMHAADDAVLVDMIWANAFSSVLIQGPPPRCSMDLWGERLAAELMLHHDMFAPRSELIMELVLPTEEGDEPSDSAATFSGMIGEALGAATISNNADGEDVCFDPLVMIDFSFEIGSMDPVAGDEGEPEVVDNGDGTTTETYHGPDGAKHEVTKDADGNVVKEVWTKEKTISYDIDGKTVVTTVTNTKTKEGGKYTTGTTDKSQTTYDADGNVISSKSDHETHALDPETGEQADLTDESHTSTGFTPSGEQAYHTESTGNYSEGFSYKSSTVFIGDQWMGTTVVIKDENGTKRLHSTPWTTSTEYDVPFELPEICLPDELVAQMINWNRLALAVTDPDPTGDREDVSESRVDIAPICFDEDQDWTLDLSYLRPDPQVNITDPPENE